MLKEKKPPRHNIGDPLYHPVFKMGVIKNIERRGHTNMYVVQWFDEHENTETLSEFTVDAYKIALEAKSDAPDR